MRDVLNKTKTRRIEDRPFPISTIETIDTAMYNFVNEVLDIKCISSNGFKKVPVVWTSAERLFQSKKDSRFRDSDGSLVLPIITIERKNVVKDLSKKGTVYANIPPLDKTRGGSISVSRRINQDKTGNFANASMYKRKGQLNFAGKNNKIVYQTVTIPLPVYISVDYEITMRAEYQQQMNQIMTPFITRPGGINYVILENGRLRYEGFMQDSYSHSNNISSFSNEERRFETKLNIDVLGWLTGEGPNRNSPNFSIRENIVEVKIPRERVALRDDLDPSTGRLYGLEGIDIGLPIEQRGTPIMNQRQVRNPGAVQTSAAASSGGGGGSSASAAGNVNTTNYKVAQSPAEAANGSRTQFTVPEDFVAGTLMVFRSGILMTIGSGNDFTLSGNTVTFEEAPENAENILFSYIKD